MWPTQNTHLAAAALPVPVTAVRVEAAQSAAAATLAAAAAFSAVLAAAAVATEPAVG